MKLALALFGAIETYIFLVCLFVLQVENMYHIIESSFFINMLFIMNC